MVTLLLFTAGFALAFIASELWFRYLSIKDKVKSTDHYTDEELKEKYPHLEKEPAQKIWLKGTIK